MDREHVVEALRAQLTSLAMGGIEQLPRPSSMSRTVQAAGQTSGEAVNTATSACNSQKTNLITSPVSFNQVPETKQSDLEQLRKSPTVAVGAESSLFNSIPPVSLPVSERCEALRQLNEQVRACTKCAELVRNRTQTVFGVGNPAPRLCFFGEAPGADEDRLGEPFVGRAGELLNRMIAACTLRREEVYILNVLKCRPPNNRAPTWPEVENCRAFFERQLEILRPEFICCLGVWAAQALLGTSRPVGKLRGTVHTWRWAKVIVTYHPAYLLRNPSQKFAAWEDLKLLMKEMGISIPERPPGRNRS